MIRIVIGAAMAVMIASPAAAQGTGRAADVDIQPILEARGRYETVDQPTIDAQAVTLRLRVGAEARLGKFSMLAEGEGTIALTDDYNAFPFNLPGEKQWRPEHAVIADPQNLELNRLQLQYRPAGAVLTFGRQRINLDDQRWVGSVGWRQNEQTFDAVRAETKIGPVAADLTYALSQRTIFGRDSTPRAGLDGNFAFASLSSKLGPLQGKLFAYLLDYDEPFYAANSSQTYGARVSGSVPVGKKHRIALRGSYARQSDHGGNPFEYAAEYWSVDAGAKLTGFDVIVGWERLGTDNGRSVQTLMATLHKFNGWADLFLTTPAAGLEDAHVTLSRQLAPVKLLRTLDATIAFHQFDSAAGDAEYGTEWNASLGFKLGKTAVLVKYADYDAKDFGTDTRKLWLQAEWAFVP